MLKTLTLLAVVGAAWSLSQYLPRDVIARDSRRASPTVTRAIADLATSPAKARSVVLIDFAVGVLPGSATTADASSEITPPTATPPTPERAPESSSVVDASIGALESVPQEPVDPVAQARLARQIQRQLRRIGCLTSAADGVWGKATKRAMQRFTDRVDADLPLYEPNVVLLMLVEKFEDRACGAPCPTGEAPNARGRCEPAQEIAAGEATAPSETSIAVREDDALEPSPDAMPEAAPPRAASALAMATDGSASLKPRTVKISISRVQTAKRRRVARLVTTSRKTRWSLPRYGLGVVNSKPGKVAAKPRKKRRIGGAAAYRRWMKRNALSLR